jgi:DNA-binding CsgD family transcriptional regulator
VLCNNRLVPTDVVGRDRELQAAAEFLDELERSPSALVLAGDPGIGKTAVWRAAVELAEDRGHRVLTARPAEPDARLSFAGLADLLDGIEQGVLAQLPFAQRFALDAAFLRAGGAGARPDPRAVFTAVLSLVRLLASELPVLLAVDDLQWLDPPSVRALQFVGRRLGSQPIGLLASTRPEVAMAGDLLAAIDDGWTSRLELGPLTVAAIQQLLKQRLHRSFQRPTLVRIYQASEGNPFHALEIGRALGEAELRPGSGLSVPEDVLSLVSRRIDQLPPATRSALLRVAAVSHPTASLLGRSRNAALKSGLIEQLADERIRFTHPLYAAAVYEASPPEKRRRIHRELAGHVRDLEERARHLASATTGPDERVAVELDRAAEQARSRGAPDTAADLQEQAFELTPPADQASASRRSLAAAEDWFQAGALAQARSLLTELLGRADRRALRVRARQLLAHVRFREKSIPEAIELLEAAATEAGDDPALRAPVELELAFAFVSVSLDHEAARPHAEALLACAEHLTEPSLLAEALAVATMVGFLLGEGVDGARLQRALALEDPEHPVPVEFRPSLIAGFLYFYTGEVERARSLLYPLSVRLRERGLEADLPILLGELCWLETLAGDLPAARAHAEEALQAAELSESETMIQLSLAFGTLVEAYSGRAEACRERAARVLEAGARTGYGLAQLFASGAVCQLELMLGDAAAAHRASAPVTEFVEAQGLDEPWRAPFLPDQIEALIGLGELDRAERLTELLATGGRRLDRPWALATSGRCRALLHAARGELEDALVATEAALAAHERLPMPSELGRTLIVKGQIDRRARRKAEARKSLERALSIFEEIGSPLWAARARAELARAIARPATQDKLTESEHQVAQLAASGLTNREVAAQLFISPKTVEANLARVYRKLGIGSRAQLGARLGAQHAPAKT